jgi:hypothetical protein
MLTWTLSLSGTIEEDAEEEQAIEAATAAFVKKLGVKVQGAQLYFNRQSNIDLLAPAE